MVQYATSGSIARTHEVSIKGLAVDPVDHLLHTVHNRVGMMILVLMLSRLVLRFRNGVPPLFYLFAALAAVHVFAAFWHQWVRRDGLLRRMMP